MVEGERVLGQPVLGYRIGMSGIGSLTYFVNAKKQLVRVATRGGSGGDRGVDQTFYDFGVPADITAPPSDQVAPG